MNAPVVMPVSSEFVELCEAQVELLSDALGASLCIVYLADEPALNGESNPQSTQFVPIIVRPEGASEWSEIEQAEWLDDQAQWHVPERISLPASTQLSAPNSALEQLFEFPAPEVGQQSESDFLSPVAPELYDAKTKAPALSAIASLAEESDSEDQLQVAMPLVYQGVMVGLLITARPDRFWTPHEQKQIEHIAKTLTTAYVIDQRARWLKKLTAQQTIQQELHAQQQDVFDDLLHQFRNPLTALRTFGKLLSRRLQSDDRNQDIAESIVRESDRLQNMLQQFKSALDESSPLLLSAATADMDEDDKYSVQVREIQQGSAQQEGNLRDIESGLPESGSANSAAIVKMGGQSSALARPFPGMDEDKNGAGYSSSEIRPELTDEWTEGISPDAPEDKNDVRQRRTSSSQYLTGHEICREPCHWLAVLEPILLIAEAIAQEKLIVLTLDIPDSLPQILADPLGLQEALSNLIDNALKYTPSGGHVHVQAGIESDGLWAIAIIDSGPGIPEADLEHLFERHYRGVQAQSEISGTGLGLAIAQDFLHQMGGEIEVFSPVSEAEFLPQWSDAQNSGPGTAFMVWLEQAETTDAE